MRAKTLNAGSRRCLDAIVSYMNEHGYAPSIREICEMTGYKSTASVSEYVNMLIMLDYLETEAPAGSPRAFRLGPKAKEIA